ncbi:Short-chain dehydrogenase/reductase family protein [Mycena venus]|uniref:Short-chain dehydrogenase/reductase family protein n=1 Tax=Mycena venus TaxID=2733690 RepID=A0A8H6XN08_9AGAR|nr:Short-chain dehydrogenase/reductase family protein [Mycena venus]
MLHHIAILYPWPMDLVVFDFFLVLAEVFGLFTLIMVTEYLHEFQSPSWTLVFSVANITIMCFSLYFRYAGYTPGRFNLFGGCDIPKPPYNRVAILFGRLASRPLVRGEPRAIAFCRGIILASLCFAIPAFGGYVTLYVPIRAVVMTRNIKVAQPWPMPLRTAHSWAPDSITLVMSYTAASMTPTALATVSRLKNSTTMFATGYGEFETCSEETVSSPSLMATIALCSYSWSDLSNVRDELFVWAQLSDPSGILYVKAGQGDPSDVNSYTEAIPLMAGSHLSVLLSRQQRDLFSEKAQDLFGFATPFKSITLTPVHVLQPNPLPPNSLANMSSLRIRMRDDIEYAGEIVQDYADTSVLNGLATFGGFWTFVNGAFAMVFGGDLLYFLLRRRPLSALGMVHIFQRRKLIRKWNEDFPTLRTEGGLPGSNSAGVVAFLRERLVDFDDDDSDLEAQNSSSDPGVVSGDEVHAIQPPVNRVLPDRQTDVSEIKEIARSV